MTARARLAILGNGLQLACVAVIAVAVMRREFFPSTPKAKFVTTVVPSDQWLELTKHGHWLGDSTAPVTLIEFADFECPACRLFWNTSLRRLRAGHTRDVGVLFRHWPLTYHKQAYPAARAAECAAAQGRFTDYYDLLYAEQDSVGRKPYARFAEEAGVADTIEFNRCYSRPGPVLAIDADIRAAMDLRSTGTPTLLLNGLQFAIPPDSAELERLVRDALKKSHTK